MRSIPQRCYAIPTNNPTEVNYMQNNQSNTSIIAEANKIVTNHLLKSMLSEVEYYLDISEIGDQHIVIYKNKLICILDASFDHAEESLIEKFCYLFTDKTDILVDVKCVDENVEVPYLKLTLQSGEIYYIQDFSMNYFKI